jgi:CheY-like chemotaxis protein
MPPSIENQRKTLASGTAPRVLVADDDPSSLLFLTEALRGLGLDVDGCGDGPTAIELARQQPFRLLVLDCRMPGAGAEQVLAALRADGYDGVAVATSAELDEATRQRLFERGFNDLLLKPCTPSDLRRVVALVDPALAGDDLLDDAQALASSGDEHVMRALRGLMRDELLQLDLEWEELAQDAIRLRDRLHRLLASCGFCGTASLATQTLLLQQHLTRGQALASGPVAGFRSTLLATIEALRSGDR